MGAAMNLGFTSRWSTFKHLTGLLAVAGSAWLAGSISSHGADPATPIPNLERIDALLPDQVAGYQRSAFGVTRRGTPLAYWFTHHDLDMSTDRVRILLLGGLDGSERSTKTIVAALRWFASDDCPAAWRQRFTLSAAPLINPDGISTDQGTANLSGGIPSARFPPEGPFYGQATTPEAAYLWRWLGTQAPDLVVEVRDGARLSWLVPSNEQSSPLGDPPARVWSASLATALRCNPVEFPAASLVAALGHEAPSETGTLAALAVECPADSGVQLLRDLSAACEASNLRGPSPARRELQRRLDRSPLVMLRQLSEHYGQTLPAVEYIPAMALVGRLRLGELTLDPRRRTEVLRIVDPYVRGDKSTIPKSGSGQSGHLIFTELARGAEGEERLRLLTLARNAADQAFSPEGGQSLDVMPYHLEMSDAFFMGGPILAAVGKLTGEQKYFDACERHLAFMHRLDHRADNLYRHSPLDETAWGRGNGFAALGLGLCLSDWPDAGPNPVRNRLIGQHDDHLRALVKHQDPTGCWHQVVDHPESYRELSSTCMITWAMARGVRGGWLDRGTYNPAIRRALGAILQRVAPNGRLIDICTGTGKQNSLREYYDREAILGLDPRGGAMAMLVAAELALYFESRR